MSRNPADICRTEIDIFVSHVEHDTCCVCSLHQISAGCVQNALWFSGRAACVQNEERMFAVERRGCAFVRCRIYDIVPPVVTSRLHCGICVGAFIYEYVANRRTFGEGVVDGGLEQHMLTSSVCSILRYNCYGAAVV